MLTCHDIAKYFLTLVDEDSGDGISNLKLQKLVYYVQGFHLAIYNYPLFNEIIEAWTHGPVIPVLYHDYKEHKSSFIPRPTDIDFSIYNEQVSDLINEVHKVYGQYSAWKLRDLTHEEAPWIKARNKNDKIISNKDMADYFKTLLVDDDGKEEKN